MTANLPPIPSTDLMRSRRLRKTRIALLVLALAALAAVAVVFRQGLIPALYSPLPLIDLAVSPWFFVDWRLASPRHDPEACRRVLTPPGIAAARVSDSPAKAGCGWTNGLRLSSAGGARISIDPLSCEAAAAFALWMEHEVQPLAVSMFGHRVASVHHMGSYACRDIAGRRFLGVGRSEHARADAIDVRGFTLDNGRQITIVKHWSGHGPESEFLRSVHQRSCRYFRVSLGPEFNAAHRDHFHLDRGIFWTCR